MYMLKMRVDITLQVKSNVCRHFLYIQDIELFQFSTASWLPLMGTKEYNRWNPPVFV